MVRILLFASALCFVGCSHAPETGRSQLIMMSSTQEIKLGDEANNGAVSDPDKIISFK